MTLTIDVEAVGWREACRMAGVASSAPYFTAHNTTVIAVVRFATRRQVNELVRHGFDEVRQAEPVRAREGRAVG